MRILRLLMGVAIIVEGVISREWMIVFAGVMFSLIPVLNIGCCSTSGCYAPIQKDNNKNEEVTFEEVK